MNETYDLKGKSSFKFISNYILTRLSQKQLSHDAKSVVINFKLVFKTVLYCHKPFTVKY